MLTKSSNVDGSGDGVGSSSHITDFSNPFAVPGTSSYAPAGNNNFLSADMDDVFRLSRGFSSSIEESGVTFRPQLNDLEIRRKARNSQILAKIQELQSNACVQAARSERLKMMRDEYESLVRKYAASKRSQWSPSSTNYMNGNTQGFPLSRYLQPLSSPLPQQQHSYVLLKETVSTASQAGQQLLTASHPFRSSTHPTKDIPGERNPNFASIGVNTDITGPIKSVCVSRDPTRDDLQQAANLEREKVRAYGEAVHVGAQTEMFLSRENDVPPQSSLSQTHQAMKHFQNNDPLREKIVLMKNVSENREPEGRETVPLSTQSYGIPTEKKMTLQLQEEDDEESSHQAERQRKQQLEKLQKQLVHQTNGQLRDDTNSISSAPSSLFMEMASTSNNTTDDVGMKQRHRQFAKMGELNEKKNHQMGSNNNKDEMKDETSQDTVSLAGKINKNGQSSNNREVVISRKILFMDDASISETTSAFTAQKEERKKLLNQLSGRKEKARNSGHTQKNRLRVNQKEKPLFDSSEDEEKSLKSGRKQKADDTQDCSSPTTAGATSESLGDSLMDSIQKTPDVAIQKVDYDVSGVRLGEKQEEINATEKVPSGGEHNRGGNDDQIDGALVVSATAALSMDKEIQGLYSLDSNRDQGDSSHFRTESGVNGKPWRERQMDSKKDQRYSTFYENEENYGLKEGQSNDPREIRSNDLSSSRAHVPDEQENFTHANNPGESSSSSSSSDVCKSSATFHKVEYADHPSKVDVPEERNQDERKNVDIDYGLDEDVQRSVTKEPTLRAGYMMSHDQIGGKVYENPGDVIKDNKVNELKNEASEMLHSTRQFASMPVPSEVAWSVSSQHESIVENVGPTEEEILQPALSGPSTESSSESSSGQVSLNEKLDGKMTGGESMGLGTMPEERVGQQHPQLPEKIHERHQQVQEQARREKEITPPVGADEDIMHDRLTPSSSDTFSLKQGAVGSQTKPRKISDKLVSNTENGSELVPREKGEKLSTNANGDGPSSVNNSKESRSSSTRQVSTTKATKAPFARGKATQVTVPIGPVRAQNTARRMRLKLHDDSDTDSSELGTGKSTMKGTGTEQHPVSSAGQKPVPDSKSATSTTDNPAKKFNEDVDDDFDDFYDNF